MIDGKFKADISNSKDGIELDMRVRGSATMTERDVLVTLLMPICDSILAFESCGCEKCVSHLKLAADIRSVIRQHFKINGGGPTIDMEFDDDVMGSSTPKRTKRTAH